MKADIARIWSMSRLVVILGFVAAVLSFLAVSFLSDGLTATRGAEKLRDFGVVAKVTDVRIHVIGSRHASDSGSPKRFYRIDDVQVAFTDPQGQQRSESLDSFMVKGVTPNSVGWTTQFEGHDSFVAKDVLYLPERPGQAQMRDQMQSTLNSGFDPAPTYIGIGLSVLGLLGWAVFARVAIGRLRPWMAARRRRLSGIA